MNLKIDFNFSVCSTQLNTFDKKRIVEFVTITKKFASKTVHAFKKCIYLKGFCHRIFFFYILFPLKSYEKVFYIMYMKIIFLLEVIPLCISLFAFPVSYATSLFTFFRFPQQIKKYFYGRIPLRCNFIF